MKNKSIQGMRGLFAIGVLLSHCYFLGEYEQSAGIFNIALQKMANVSFFFIMAGFFLVNSSSVKLPASQFLKKKMLRIYPLHLLVLLALVGLSVVTGSFQFSIHLPLNALLVQTWFPSLESATSYNTVSWFLSSLLFCYIVGYGVVRLLGAGEKCRKYIYILTALLVLYKVVIAIVFPTDNTGYYWCYLCPIAGCADFMVGVSLALLMKDRKMPRSTWLQLLAIAFLTATFVLKHYLPRNYCTAFLMLPANVLLLVSFVSETGFSKAVFGNRLMCFLGDISFEIYLLHTFIIGTVGSRSVVTNISKNISPFLTLLMLIGCCITAAMAYKMVFAIITKKLNKLKTKNI